MQTLWTEDPAEYHGKYVKFPVVRCLPQPLQKPRPSLHLGGQPTNVRTHRRVAEWGDGWMPALESEDDLAAFADGMRSIRERASTIGREDADSLEFTVAGLDGMWMTKDKLDKVAAAGADRVTLWLPHANTAQVLGELDRLAQFIAMYSDVS